MGSNASKSHNEEIKNDESESPENPDPRSPTSDIVRTPLQNKNESKHNITKNVDLRQTFENGDDKIYHCNPILSAVIKNHLQSYDPRSPTQDFDRTPIIIASKIKELVKEQNLQLNESDFEGLLKYNDELNDSCNEATELNDDNLVSKKLCDVFFDMTLDDNTIKNTEEPLGEIPSNETTECGVTNETCSDKKKLLETNFDYIQNNEFEKFEDKYKHIAKIKNLDKDPRSPSMNIDRTPISVAGIEENVEDMSDETLIKVLQNKNADLRHTMTKTHEKNPEGLLIYEDESTPDAPTCIDTPKKSKSDSSGSRTPLSCMRNKDDAGYIRSKSVNTLYDPKRQNSKIIKRVSQIPRLKSLTRPSRTMQMGSTISLKNITKPPVMIGDCENTPPHSHRDRWDKDNSIVL